MIVELERRDASGRSAVAGLDRFPFVVGRGESDLQLVEPGIWDRHFSIDRGEGGSFRIVPVVEAPVSVNGVPVPEPRPLRNGDLIQCGAVRLQFRLSATRPRSLVWREQATWALLASLLVLELLIALAWPS